MEYVLLSGDNLLRCVEDWLLIDADGLRFMVMGNV